MKPCIVVDIDNTLWDFAPVLWERLRRINPEVPRPSEWNEWRFWDGYIDRQSLYNAIDEIHIHQGSYSPYPEARSFLTALRENGSYIIIASHRQQEAYEPTIKWLHMFDLPFEELHLSIDKSVLFADCCAIIDDSPITVDKAAQAGIVRAGLRHPWNSAKEHPLFDTLTEILAYLERKCTMLNA